MNAKKLDIKTSLINSEILHFKEIDSTNLYFLNSSNVTNGKVVVADFQSAGRGRLARKWESPQSDALLFSLLLNKNLDVYHPTAFTFLTSIAILEALKKNYRELPIILKWPNDILVEGKKICGILVESRSSASSLKKVVIGIGINVNQDNSFFQKPELQHGTSLKLATGQESDRFYLLETILESLDENLLFAQNQDISEILKKWKQYCPYIGKPIKLLENDNEHFGIFEDLNPEGGIILNIQGKTETFYAADVSIDKEYL